MGSSLLDPLRALRNTAAPPVPYAPRSTRGVLGGLLGRPAGQEAQMRAQGTNGTLFAIVDRIITSYSQVEWHLYRKAKSGLKEDRIEVTRHAALDLWNAPNGFMVGPTFRETSQQHEELTGEQWWVVARSPHATVPLELWPVRPDRMRPVADPETFISGYEYVGPSGEVVPLGLDEVIFQRRPNPLDIYRGLGPVQTILTDLDSSRYSREWNRQFFLNSAEPGGIIEVDKRLDDDEFDEARERWAEQHRGVAAAHRVAILENGLKWVDRNYSNRDMQFVELNQVSDEKIRTAFGFPKPMLGAVDDVNRANAEAAEVVLARWLTVPRLQRTKSVLNNQLLPMYGPTTAGLEFDYDSPVPEDVEAETAALVQRATAAGILITAGLDSVGVLAATGLPPIAYSAPPKQPARPTPPPVEEPEDQPANAWRAATAALLAEPENAMRWVAEAHDDENTCKPCLDNDGHVYRNRAQAYQDYPGGASCVDCIGAKYGNKCRCKVVKRRASKEDD